MVAQGSKGRCSHKEGAGDPFVYNLGSHVASLVSESAGQSNHKPSYSKDRVHMPPWYEKHKKYWGYALKLPHGVILPLMKPSTSHTREFFILTTSALAVIKCCKAWERWVPVCTPLATTAQTSVPQPTKRRFSVSALLFQRQMNL